MDTPLRYWRQGHTEQNFGDFLSELLLRELFLPFFPVARAVHLIGSVVDEAYLLDASADEPTLFWGTGARSSQPISASSLQGAKFYAVRGPLTAQVLGRHDLPLGEPGLLIPALYEPNQVKELHGKTICIPHFYDGSLSDDDIIAASQCDVVLRPNIANNFASLLNFIDVVSSATFVLSASLHGAVTACALGVPFAFWDNGKIDIPFKWEDFSALVNIRCCFVRNLAEGRGVFREVIGPNLSIPSHIPILTRAPLFLKPSARAKVIAFELSVGRTSPESILEADWNCSCDESDSALLEWNMNQLSRPDDAKPHFLQLVRKLVETSEACNAKLDSLSRANEALSARILIAQNELQKYSDNIDNLAVKLARSTI